MIKEYKNNWFSKYPKISKKENNVIIVIFGILYLVKSVYDRSREKMKKDI